MIICEGQKAQAAYAGLGFQCVTSILGANNAHLSDWASINHAELIYYSPDNDEKGEQYIQHIHKILNEIPAKIIRLPKLPTKGDICDWLKQQRELGSWNELDSLKNHPFRDVVQRRLQQVINENLHEIPMEWHIAGWPEPEIPQNNLLAVEPLRDCLIPEPFREWVIDIAERMQCPKDL